jgi:hypothetical protein
VFWNHLYAPVEYAGTWPAFLVKPNQQITARVTYQGPNPSPKGAEYTMTFNQLSPATYLVASVTFICTEGQ